MKDRNEGKSKRDLAIDVAKGIGIFLVVLAHTIENDFVHNFIYMFHMPLFFLLAGMTIKYSIKNEPKDFIIKKLKRVIIPYLFFCIISFIYWAVIERQIRDQMDVSVLSNFINIFLCRTYEPYYSYNVAMWFIPCLFTSELIIYFILKKVKNKVSNFIISFILFVLGYILSYYKITLVFAIETAFVAQFFIMIGYLFSIFWYNNVTLLKRICLGILSIISIALSVIFENKVAMLGHNYDNVFLFVIGAIGGSYLIWELSVLLKKSKVLQFFGANSLVILGFHEPIKRVTIKLFSVILKVSNEFARSYCAVIITIIILIVFVPIIFIFNRYFPVLVGRSRVVNEK